MHLLLEYRGVFYALLAFILGVSLSLPASATERTGRAVVLIEINGPIGPGTSDYVVRNIEKADAQNAPAIVLRIDAPGGLQEIAGEKNSTIVFSFPLELIRAFLERGKKV